MSGKLFKKNSPCALPMCSQTPLFQLELSASRSRLPPAPGLLIGLLTLATVAACRTAPPLPPVNLSDPRWTLQQGQAVWRSQLNAPEIAGELLVASRGGL